MIDEVLRGELVEGDLDRLIERRATHMNRANAEDAAEKLAARSRARRYREAVLWQKLDFHRAQLESHTATFSKLLDRHRTGLRLCEEALGIDHQTEGDAA